MLPLLAPFLLLKQGLIIHNGHDFNHGLKPSAQLIDLAFESDSLLGLDDWKWRSKDVDISGIGVSVGAVIVVIVIHVYVVSHEMKCGKKIDIHETQKGIYREPQFCGHVPHPLSWLTYTLGRQFAVT
jgi:hypothetical protein